VADVPLAQSFSSHLTPDVIPFRAATTLVSPILTRMSTARQFIFQATTTLKTAAILSTKSSTTVLHPRRYLHTMSPDSSPPLLEQTLPRTIGKTSFSLPGTTPASKAAVERLLEQDRSTYHCFYGPVPFHNHLSHQCVFLLFCSRRADSSSAFSQRTTSAHQKH
jgi:hypothetical protein